MLKMPLWLEEKTTGIFHEFYSYVKGMLNNPAVFAEHEQRVRNFVKTLDKKDIPSYLQQYVKKELNTTI